MGIIITVDRCNRAFDPAGKFKKIAAASQFIRFIPLTSETKNATKLNTNCDKI
jgi:hypothetical protein